MFQKPPREKEWLTWFFVAVWSLVVFVSIPLARTIRALIRSFLPGEAFTVVAIAGTIVAAGIAVAYLLRIPFAHRRASIAWLTLTVGIFVFLIMTMMQVPEEGMHFLEYGFLGLLMFRALSHRYRDPLVYISAILLVLVVGTVDEFIQWLTPGRYWDHRDIFHNGLAAALAQVALAKGMRPPHIRMPIRPATVRLTCRLALALLLMAAFCVSNTPAFVMWYADRVPFLAFLRTNDSVMCEYGYRHNDPEIGVFYSRFTIEELHQLDAERGEDVGRILIKMQDAATYRELLRAYTAGIDPFLHEALVRLNRRNHYMAVLWKYVNDKPSYRYHQTVAWRENQILEKYFARSLEAAEGRLSPEALNDLGANILTESTYKSPVSEHLITRFTERELLAMIVGAMLLLVLIDRRWGRERSHVEEAATGT